MSICEGELYPDTENDSIYCVGGNENEKNIPAQEAPEKARARLYEENGYKERKKGSRTPPRKGQKKTFSLIDDGTEKI